MYARLAILRFKEADDVKKWYINGQEVAEQEAQDQLAENAWALQHGTLAEALAIPRVTCVG